MGDSIKKIVISIGIIFFSNMKPNTTEIIKRDLDIIVMQD